MNRPPHVEASFQFLGLSARRVRTRWRTELDHLDLVHEGWLAFQEAATKGRPVEQCYAFAEHRMETAVEREDRAQRPYAPDQRRGVRRLSPGDWRDLQAFLRRSLADSPSQLRAMTLLYRGRSVLEVARELGITESRAYMLRTHAIAKLTTALSQATANVVVPP